MNHAPRAAWTRLLPALILLSACASDPPARASAPKARPQTPSTTGSGTAWEGLYTDARRTLKISREASGLRVELEDNSVLGWSKPYAGAVTESGGVLHGVLPDRYATGIEIGLEGESLRRPQEMTPGFRRGIVAPGKAGRRDNVAGYVPEAERSQGRRGPAKAGVISWGRLTLTTTREGHENPRTHTLVRIDPGVRERAEAVYREVYPQKTVGFPRRRGELLVTAALEARDADPARAAALFAAAAELLWPLTKLTAGALHEEGRCLVPSRNPQGSWDAASERFARAAALRGEVGDTTNQAVSIFNQAHCENPAQNGAGSIERALDLYERAAKLAGASAQTQLRGKARVSVAALLHRQAWQGQPDRGGTLTWERTVSLYRRAVKLREVEGAQSELATSLNNLAFALSPSRNPQGTWGEAAGTHGRVAALRKASGDEEGRRFSLRQQARCLAKHAQESMPGGVLTPKARGLLKKARGVAKRAGDGDLARSIDSLLKR